MVKGVPYTPDRGDLIWLEFTPHAGHEQARRRPALVLSKASYNKTSSFIIVCPVTSKPKGWPFEVTLSHTGKIKGAVFSDQIKSVDNLARQAKFIEKADAATVETVLSNALELLK